MNPIMHKGGMKTLAGILSGKVHAIDVMYVEYSKTGDMSPVQRDDDYYKALKAKKGAGYVRIPVALDYDDTGHVIAVGTICPDDMVGIPAGMKLTCATLAVSSHDGDIFVMTIELKTKPKVVQGTYATVRTSFALENQE